MDTSIIQSAVENYVTPSASTFFEMQPTGIGFWAAVGFVAVMVGIPLLAYSAMTSMSSSSSSSSSTGGCGC